MHKKQKKPRQTTTKPGVRVCSRGHRFYHTSTCPVCPICWSGYYRRKYISDFPDALAAPALRALQKEKITMLAQLTRYTSAEVLELHGMGPKAVQQLRRALRRQHLDFKKA